MSLGFELQLSIGLRAAGQDKWLITDVKYCHKEGTQR